MDVTINIHMSWTDSRLSWDRKLYSDIRSIHLHPDNIWRTAVFKRITSSDIFTVNLYIVCSICYGP